MDPETKRKETKKKKRVRVRVNRKRFPTLSHVIPKGLTRTLGRKRESGEVSLPHLVREGGNVVERIKEPRTEFIIVLVVCYIK